MPSLRPAAPQRAIAFSSNPLIPLNSPSRKFVVSLEGVPPKLAAAPASARIRFRPIVRTRLRTTAAAAATALLRRSPSAIARSRLSLAPAILPPTPSTRPTTSHVLGDFGSSLPGSTCIASDEPSRRGSSLAGSSRFAGLAGVWLAVRCSEGLLAASGGVRPLALLGGLGGNGRVDAGAQQQDGCEGSGFAQKANARTRAVPRSRHCSPS